MSTDPGARTVHAALAGPVQACFMTFVAHWWRRLDFADYKMRSLSPAPVPPPPVGSMGS